MTIFSRRERTGGRGRQHGRLTGQRSISRRLGKVLARAGVKDAVANATYLYQALMETIWHLRLLGSVGRRRRLGRRAGAGEAHQAGPGRGPARPRRQPKWCHQAAARLRCGGAGSPAAGRPALVDGRPWLLGGDSGAPSHGQGSATPDTAALRLPSFLASAWVWRTPGGATATRLRLFTGQQRGKLFKAVADPRDCSNSLPRCWPVNSRSRNGGWPALASATPRRTPRMMAIAGCSIRRS